MNRRERATERASERASEPIAILIVLSMTSFITFAGVSVDARGKVRFSSL
jgi:hypothetical protein